MNHFRKYLAAAAGLLILAIAGALMDTHKVAAQAPTLVTVTNTPLPVTGSLHITGSSHAPLPVRVTHVDTPVDVRDVENPARQIFEKIISGPIPISGTSLTTTIFTAPLGKRLVIEYVSARILMPLGQKVSFQVQLSVGPSIPLVNVPAISQGTFFAEDLFIASQQVRIYVDPGVGVSLVTSRSTTSGGWNNTDWSVVGHLVDCTVAAPCPPSP